MKIKVILFWLFAVPPRFFLIFLFAKWSKDIICYYDSYIGLGFLVADVITYLLVLIWWTLGDRINGKEK